MDNFISAIIQTSKKQIKHVVRGILHGIHDVFSPSKDDKRDPILLKKLKKGKGTYDTVGRVGRYELTCMNSHVLIYMYEFMSETETSFQCRKLKQVSVVVLVPPEAFGSPEENRYSGENRDIAIRKKIAISLFGRKSRSGRKSLAIELYQKLLTRRP